MTTAVVVPTAARHDPGWRRASNVVRRHPEIVTALLCGFVLAVGQRGPDLPAAAYRVFLFRQHGFVAFDSRWYAGHPLPGYSLLFPPLASVVGARLLGALACVASTALFARLVRAGGSTARDVAALWFGVVVVVDLVVGRIPFALGLAFGLAAVIAVRDARGWRALFYAVCCGAASPLAGAFLLLLAAAWLFDIGLRAVLPCAGALVGIVAAALFGEGGWFPFVWTSLLIIGLLCVGGLVLIPRSRRLVRRGLVFYGLASLALFPFPNPIGGNMIRLGAVVGGPVIGYELVRARRLLLLALVTPALLVWEFAPLPTSIAGSGDPSARAGYYTGLLSYLHAHHASRSRLEVPLTRGRWEADYLASQVPLARGWERQLDLEHNAVLYRPHLSASAYHHWLLRNGVRWVALPDVRLDASEVAEQRLLTQHPPHYLRLVWQDPHWKLWAVRGGPSLVRGPARLIRIGVSTIALDAKRAGTAIVLVHWTRFWRVTTGAACIGPTDGGWTRVQLVRPGPVTITAPFGLGSLAGAGGEGSCSPGLSPPG